MGVKTIVTILMAFTALSSLEALAGDEQNTQVHIYGTPSNLAICVTVSDDFIERGKHYIPMGTKFTTFLKSLHERTDIKIDPFHSYNLIRNGNKVPKPGNVQVENGDVIAFQYYNW